jgi:hypothetical protein
VAQPGPHPEEHGASVLWELELVLKLAGCSPATVVPIGGEPSPEGEQGAATHIVVSGRCLQNTVDCSL